MATGGYASYFALVFGAVGFLTVMLSGSYLKRSAIEHGEYYALVLFAVVKKNATTILEKLKEAHGLFPEGSGGGETRAKAEIWTDRAGFDKAMKESQAAATAMSAVTAEADYVAAMKALGGSCKGCHDKYRLPKQ